MGTFAFQRMPFGLSNAGATFQRDMDHALGELVNKSLLVYLDDIHNFLMRSKHSCLAFGTGIHKM